MKFPRRDDIQLNTTVELTLHQAIKEIEALGTDERVAHAVRLLDQARSFVADIIDERLLDHSYRRKATFEPEQYEWSAPKTMDYCVNCGQSPDSAVHILASPLDGGHDYVRPITSRR